MRLTRRFEEDGVKAVWCRSINDTFLEGESGYEEAEKLAAYEDAEEQGLLIRVPSRKVWESSGDAVYYIYDYEIVECINCGISVDCEGNIWIALACDEDIFPYRTPIPEIDTSFEDWCKNSTDVKIEEWGKTVFLTREEAEAALAEMEK